MLVKLTPGGIYILVILPSLKVNVQNMIFHSDVLRGLGLTQGWGPLN